jgi:RNA polymerase sigma-70 factor, ECF subfamily
MQNCVSLFIAENPFTNTSAEMRETPHVDQIKSSQPRRDDMVATSSADITGLLKRFQSGDRHAEEELLRAVHKELRVLAGHYMNLEGPGHLLQPTALINEAYLRLAKQRDTDWQNRTHFFAVAAQAMRRILVDYARNANARRRGGGLRPISLESDPPPGEGISSEMLAVSQALDRLSSLHPVQAKVVELKYFGGLTDAEIAAFLNLGQRTVEKYLRLAKAWLKVELEQ